MASGRSVVSPVLELLPRLKNEKGEFITEPFLACCRLIIPIIEKFGTAMSIIRTDISGNIARLEKSFKADRDSFSLLYTFVRKEVNTGKPLDPYGNTSALFWLLRAVDFLVFMVNGLERNTTWSVSEAATTAYKERLKKYHGWLTQQAFAVVLKFSPERSLFYSQLGDDSVHGELDRFVAECQPIVTEIDEYLANNGAHSLTAS